jgi:hypothetical protein
MRSVDFNDFQYVLNDFLSISHLHRFGNGARGFGVAFGNHPSAWPRSPSFPGPVRPRPSTTGAPSHRAPTQKPCLNQGNTLKTYENHAYFNFFAEFLIFQRGPGV